MERLTVLGTGAANALRYYNTCFMLQGPQGGLLVDGGGGNGILVQLEKAGISLLDLTTSSSRISTSIIPSASSGSCA